MGSAQTLLCPTCGSANDRSADFCENCGEYLQWSGAAPEPGESAPDQPPPEGPSPLHPNTGIRTGSSGPSASSVETVGTGEPGPGVTAEPPAGPPPDSERPPPAVTGGGRHRHAADPAPSGPAPPGPTLPGPARPAPTRADLTPPGPPASARPTGATVGRPPVAPARSRFAPPSPAAAGPAPAAASAPAAPSPPVRRPGGSSPDRPAPARPAVQVPTARHIPTVVKDLGPRSGLVPKPPPVDPTAQPRRFKQPATIATTGPGLRRPTAMPSGPGVPGTCRSCGRTNPPGRRYCRCGLPLVSVDPPAQERRPPPAAIRGRRAFTRAMRAAGQGTRPRWDRPVVGRVRAARAAIAAALIGLLVLTFTGPGARARTWLAAGGVALVPYAYRAIEAQNAQVSAPDAVVEGYAATYAVDGTSSLSWAITWTDPAVPARCGGSAGPALVIEFAEASDLTRVILNPGLDPTDANRVRQVVPRVVDIESESGCERLTLVPTPGPQEFDLDLPDTSQVRVQIVDTEPPDEDAPTDNLLAGLSEIRFYAG